MIIRKILAAIGLLASSSMINADVLTIPLSDPNGNFPATGTVVINNNTNGIDQLDLTVSGMQANRTFTLFLAGSPDVGALPVQFLGAFTTDNYGQGSLTINTEIGDAFAAANPVFTNDNGVAPVVSGALANGALGVPLNWIRIYQATPDANFAGSVFSVDGQQVGGFHVLSSEISFDNDLPLHANAGNNQTVSAPASIDDRVTIIFDGVNSQGDIVSYNWSILQHIDTGIAISSPIVTPAFQDSPFFNPDLVPTLTESQARITVSGSRVDNIITGRVFNDLTGQQIIVQLTVTDSVGNESIADTVTVTFQ